MNDNLEALFQKKTKLEEEKLEVEERITEKIKKILTRMEYDVKHTKIEVCDAEIEIIFNISILSSTELEELIEAFSKEKLIFNAVGTALKHKKDGLSLLFSLEAEYGEA